MLLPSRIVCSVFILSLQVESLQNGQEKERIVIDSAGTSSWGSRRRRSRRRAVKGKKTKRVYLDFGGDHHGIDDTDGAHMRPEVVKMQVCESSTSCSECTSQSSCWHGYSTGKLKLDVPASSAHNRFAAEVWASCSDPKSMWKVRVWANGLQNGVLNVYVNGKLFKTVTNSYWWGQDSSIPIKKDSRLRAEFVRTDTKTKASGFISMWAHVDDYVDNCMGVKNCLVKLGDGSDAAFLFRNSNAKQLKCISASTTHEQDMVSDHCRPWVTCLSKESGRKNQLEILLKAGVGKEVVQGELVAKPGTHKNDQDCIDPAVADAESWNCECMAELAESCGGADEDCFRKKFCANYKICNSWKDNNCGSSFSLIAKENASIKESALTMRSEVGIDSAAGSGLDGALSGKCAG